MECQSCFAPPLAPVFPSTCRTAPCHVFTGASCSFHGKSVFIEESVGEGLDYELRSFLGGFLSEDRFGCPQQSFDEGLCRVRIPDSLAHLFRYDKLLRLSRVPCEVAAESPEYVRLTGRIGFRASYVR